MKIKRMRKKCSVPRCKHIDTVAVGIGGYLDTGCIHLCKEHAHAYAKAWSDIEKAERDAAKAAKADKAEKAGE